MMVPNFFRAPWTTPQRIRLIGGYVMMLHQKILTLALILLTAPTWVCAQQELGNDILVRIHVVDREQIDQWEGLMLERMESLRATEQGYRHIRIHMGGYGGQSDTIQKPEGAPDGAYYHPREYVRRMTEMIEQSRAVPDVHVRIDGEHRLGHDLVNIDAVRRSADCQHIFGNI